jgi:hypothetical protein
MASAARTPTPPRHAVAVAHLGGATKLWAHLLCHEGEETFGNSVGRAPFWISWRSRNILEYPQVIAEVSQLSVNGNLRKAEGSSMTILLQVLEQSFTPTTPWERRKFTFIHADKIVGMRLDGQCGVWLDLSRPGESQRLACTLDPGEAITFLLTTFAKIAECEERGGAWLIGHDGMRVGTIAATRFPPRTSELAEDELLARAWL